MEDKSLLTIGKVTGVHGLGGNLKVWSFAESVDTFAPGTPVWLRPEGPVSGVDTSRGRSFLIERSSIRKKGVLLTLEGVDNREAAEAIVGYEILVDKDLLPDLDEDTWYWEELYGLEVIDRDRGFLGVIESIFPTGANDVLVVKDMSGGQEILIPMHRRFVTSVDMEKKQVTTELPEGY